MLVINPDECIDCGVCEPECPGLFYQIQMIKKEAVVNEEFSEQWPNIVKKGVPSSDGDKFKDEEDKFSKYFSKKPGSGSLE